MRHDLLNVKAISIKNLGGLLFQPWGTFLTFLFFWSLLFCKSPFQRRHFWMIEFHIVSGNNLLFNFLSIMILVAGHFLKKFCMYCTFSCKNFALSELSQVLKIFFITWKLIKWCYCQELEEKGYISKEKISHNSFFSLNLAQERSKIVIWLVWLLARGKFLDFCRKNR